MQREKEMADPCVLMYVLVGLSSMQCYMLGVKGQQDLTMFGLVSMLDTGWICCWYAAEIGKGFTYVHMCWCVVFCVRNCLGLGEVQPGVGK